MKFFPYWKRQYSVPAGFVAIFAVIGVAILVISHAASPYVSIAADQGSIAGNACEVPDADPSDGNAVQFGGSPCTSPSGTVLFDGSLVSSWASNQSCSPTRTQDVSDPDGQSDSVIQFTTLDTDVAPCTPTDNPRSQLASPEVYEAGETYWTSYELWIPSGSPLIDATGWTQLGEALYGEPFNGSPPFAIDVNYIAGYEGLQGVYLSWETPTGYAWTTPIAGVVGQWVRITWQFNVSETGAVALYVNDAEVASETTGALDSSDDEGPWYANLNLYYEAGEYPSATVFYKDFKIATTQSAAED